MDNSARGGPERVEADTVNLRGGPIGVVEAEVVRIRQGGANQIIAHEVEIHQGGVIQIEADAVGAHQAGILVARGSVISVDAGGVGAAIGEDVLLAGSRSLLTVGGRVDIQEGSSVILMAREVHGSVHTLLDTSGAMLAGLTAGVAVGLVLFLGGLISRHRDPGTEAP
jgi:hypothetical protein